MKCPYMQSGLIHSEKLEHDLISEETGVTKGHKVVITEKFVYSDCLQEECAAYHDGKCCYKK